MHPRTKKKLADLSLKLSEKITVIEPVGYLNMIWLIKHCLWVMTDSGGLQKEAFFFQKYCITLRDETEWVELVNNGFNCLVGADEDKIKKASRNVDMAIDFDMDLYGKGQASNKIVRALIDG